ncbi:MAG: GntR family transcriptional regulator [Clostridiales bacterium]|nr:GntR family transcriptional regulator [Clostridiales bacterium]
MSVISVDTLSRKPLYEQLVENIRQNVLLGTLSAGEQLPSVRALAGELAINPNTIQKAYAELERMGIIYSIPGRGSFISDDIDGLAFVNRRRLLDELKRYLIECFESGLERSEIDRVVSEIWRTDIDKQNL